MNVLPKVLSKCVSLSVYFNEYCVNDAWFLTVAVWKALNTLAFRDGQTKLVHFKHTKALHFVHF